MITAICEFIIRLFGGNIVLATMFVSMIPFFELKTGIPFGMNSEFWKHPLSNWEALALGVAGGLIVTILLALVFKPIYEKIKDKKFFRSFVSFFTASAIKKKETLEKKSLDESTKKQIILKMLGVFVFVAIPVPGTGVYTGTILAVLLGLGFWKSVLAVSLGNFCAGLIIMFICSIFPEITTILIGVFVALVLMYLIYKVIINILNKKKEQKEK